MDPETLASEASHGIGVVYHGKEKTYKSVKRSIPLQKIM